MIQSIDADKLAISFKKEQEFFYQQVAQNEVVQQLMDLVGKHWGRPYKVEVQLAGGGAAQGLSPIEAKDKKQNEADKEMRAKIEAHPLVKEAKNVLKAKITSIKESK
jgi:DNA polymerase-3 subunit gamma/tau